MNSFLRRSRPRAMMLGVAAAGALAATTLSTGPASAVSIKTEPLQHIQLLSVNDFHGNLEPPTGSSGLIGTVPAGGAAYLATHPPPPRPGALPGPAPAGGAAYLATHLKQLRAGQRDTYTVAAGDLIGASPLLSAAFHDEATIEAMNLMGLQLSSVGNHEFDE